MGSAGQRQYIVVQIAKNFKSIDYSQPRIKRLIKIVCKRYKLLKVTVSIAIVNDDEIRRINKRFLNRKGTSDCLSFDLSKKESRKLFDLAVNGEMAVRQSSKRGHSPEAELALYITHGLLHNLGFDDSTQRQAKKMHETEDEILQQFGYGFVYNA